MKKNSLSPAPKGKSKSLTKIASPELVHLLNQHFPKKVPVATITAASKLYNRSKALRKDDRIIRRLAGNDSDISTATLIDLISSQETHERGKPLSE
jgi:hypothetical protein